MAHLSNNPTWQSYPSTATLITAVALENIENALDLTAPAANPSFTGVPTAPTPVATDNSTRIATTAFVAAAKALAPVTNLTATTYNVQATDVGSILTVSNAAGVTVALPADLIATIPIGSSLTLINIGTGALSIRGSTGGAVVNGVLGPTVISPTYPRWAKVVAVKIAADTWIVG